MKEEGAMSSTKEVLDRHLRSFSNHDLNGILCDYAPGAVLFTPAGPLREVDAIKSFFQALIAEFRKPGATFNLEHQSVEGDYGYILWTAETADNVYGLGTDTFVVRDGKIVVQSFAGKITSKR
jgi:ketosteroid isomerase-like protein